MMLTISDSGETKNILSTPMKHVFPNLIFIYTETSDYLTRTFYVNKNFQLRKNMFYDGRPPRQQYDFLDE